jgi:drug/metabolite transporter (DMT)-like permease
MGELLALFSSCCFAASNVTLTRGAGGKGKDNGAFLSILLTVVLGGAIWLWDNRGHGFPAMHLRSMLWFAGAGILTIFIGRVFLYASVQRLGAVPASAIKRLNPAFSVLLGVILLGEAIDRSMVIGMLLIGASVAVLVWQSLNRAASNGDDAPQQRSVGSTLANLGYFYGPVSALAYALGYVARKEGLVEMPEPAFGSMFGALVGALVFVLIARFVDSYRVALRQTFTAFNPWLFAAGILSSAGQLLYFAALSSAPIARCAVISSMEAIFTIFFSVAVSRSFKQLSAPVVLAAALGVAGTLFIVMNR